jgi:hypothetical protein
MEGDAEDRATIAIARWVDALNAAGKRERLGEAVEPRLRVERFGHGAHAGRVVELIEGEEACGRWMALSPDGTHFSVTSGPSEATVEGEPCWEATYRISVAGFRNGGRWTFGLGPSGRIAWLRHAPNQLADDTASEVRDPKETWRRYTVPIPVMAHDHDHHEHPHPTPGGERND